MKGLTKKIPLLMTVACLAMLPGRASHAGTVGAAIKGGKAVGKAALKEAGREAVEKAAQKGAAALVRKQLGHSAADIVEKTAARLGRHPDEVASELLAHGKHVYQAENRCVEALEFGLTHGRTGRALLKEMPIHDLARAGWTSPGAHPVIREADRILHGVRGSNSFSQLRATMTAAGMNSHERTVCESIFDIAARRGRIDSIPKGTELISGKVGPHGIDRLWIEKDSGLVHFVEFGTGAKPAHAGEMAVGKLRDQWARYVETLDNDALINLRGKGVPPPLLNAGRVRDPNFPLHEFISRDIHAVEKNAALLQQHDPEVKFFPLP